MWRERNPEVPRLTLMSSHGQMTRLVDDEVMFVHEDFQFLGRVNDDLHYIIVRPDLGIRNFDDLIAASANRALLFGTSGIGSSEPQHGVFLTSLLAEQGIHLAFDYVHYSGAGEISAAFLSRDIEVTIGNTLNATTYMNAGAGIPIAVIARERSEAFPDVETLVEQGCPADVVETIEVVLKALFRFNATPVADARLVAIMREAMSMALQDPELIAAGAERNLFVRYLPWEEDYRVGMATAASFEEHVDLIRHAFGLD